MVVVSLDVTSFSPLEILLYILLYICICKTIIEMNFYYTFYYCAEKLILDVILTFHSLFLFLFLCFSSQST